MIIPKIKQVNHKGPDTPDTIRQHAASDFSIFTDRKFSK